MHRAEIDKHHAMVERSAKTSVEIDSESRLAAAQQTRWVPGKGI
jgi:hypothetical protein